MKSDRTSGRGRRPFRRILLQLLTAALLIGLSACAGDSDSIRSALDGLRTENRSGTDSTAGQEKPTDKAEQAAVPAPDDSGGTSDPQHSVPPYSGVPYIVLNENRPDFSAGDLQTTSYEYYSPLDSSGRCGPCIACIGRNLMPTGKRRRISRIKPTAWQYTKYDSVDGKFLYNRCHLIGYQLTGENANARNLITGTRYMNTDGMLPFENMVADYVKETGNHVLYRVTPVFTGNQPLADGVILEARSVEDDGAGVEFHVYCYNVQPGIRIDYTDGSSEYTGTEPVTKPVPLKHAEASAANAMRKADGRSAGYGETDSGKNAPAYENSGSADFPENGKTDGHYVLNRRSHIFHRPDCPGVHDMSAANRQDVTQSREELLHEGYRPCQICHP